MDHQPFLWDEWRVKLARSIPYIAGGAVLLASFAIIAIYIWPTRYRYEARYRCQFAYGQPQPNDDPTGKKFFRTVTADVNDESYRIDRLTGEIFISSPEGWKLAGLTFASPGQFLQGDALTGRANTGCHMLYLELQEADDPNAPLGAWAMIKKAETKEIKP